VNQDEDKEPTTHPKMMIITKFKQEYMKDITLKLYWSTVLEEHFVCTKDGVRLERGLWISKERLLTELVPLAQQSEELLKAFLAGLDVFKDKGFKTI
jgi:hypothetical protein